MTIIVHAKIPVDTFQVYGVFIQQTGKVTMFLTLHENDKRPIYQQITDGIKDLIARGELREGMTLPSVRQVAGDLGVNLNTVAVAYRQLQDEGFVTVRHGAGAMISSRNARPVEQAELYKPLQTALTQLVLSGLTGSEIVETVREQLAQLQEKGATR
jgi:GntR family transcriptional regulator